MTLPQIKRRFEGFIGNFWSPLLRIHMMRAAFGSLNRPLHEDDFDLHEPDIAMMLLFLEVMGDVEVLEAIRALCLSLKAELIAQLAGQVPLATPEFNHRQAMQALLHLIRTHSIEAPTPPLSQLERRHFLFGNLQPVRRRGS